MKVLEYCQHGTTRVFDHELIIEVTATTQKKLTTQFPDKTQFSIAARHESVNQARKVGINQVYFWFSLKSQKRRNNDISWRTLGKSIS
jgi:hypothetical protein